MLVLTGAGCSTESGIPDYRDAGGGWKHRRPVMYQEFVNSAAARQRYWARSLIGWRRIAAASPNRAHLALARFEAAGIVQHLITQNVDGLHDRAGSHRVIDLHGRLDTVQCLECGAMTPRAAFQERLESLNPDRIDAIAATIEPDGDADPGGIDYARFDVPARLTARASSSRASCSLAKGCRRRALPRRLRGSPTPTLCSSSGLP